MTGGWLAVLFLCQKYFERERLFTGERERGGTESVREGVCVCVCVSLAGCFLQLSSWFTRCPLQAAEFITV